MGSWGDVGGDSHAAARKLLTAVTTTSLLSFLWTYMVLSAFPATMLRSASSMAHSFNVSTSWTQTSLAKAIAASRRKAPPTLRLVLDVVGEQWHLAPQKIPQTIIRPPHN